ncbi:flavin monoamine oxidase family protein [Arhodomonas sp. AD133]|uniref:flavin monoamine oxidase family protein n=1 Tax=Arhodomonas sp. AD133 TaxID=3415009 RepID=UPI003EBA3B29
MSSHSSGDRASRTASKQQRFENFRKALLRQASRHLSDRRAERLHAEEPPKATFAAEPRRTRSDVSVGIVGGGMAGLYAGLLLDELGIHYHIFEASGERLGGRVRSYYFDDRPHQYAELGAMRFPDNFMQSRLFATWQYLNETAASVPGAREIPKIPYYMHDPTSTPDAGNLLAFNGCRPVTRNEAAADNTLLGFDQFFEGPEWDHFKRDGKLKPAQELLDNAINPFVEMFEDEGVDEAWETMLKYDGFSARGYLQTVGDGVAPYPARIVDYIESVLSYTGIFDLSLIEIVLDQFSFAATEQWYTMDGGVSRITDELANRVPGERVTMNARVSELRGDEDGAELAYRPEGGLRPRRHRFDRIISTLPFSVLKTVDTPVWQAGKREAMRTLKMTNAVKIALGFRSRFWETEGPYSKGMKGGQSDTDLNVRSIVYPSFGIGEPGPAYILGSYSWQNDADKFSHLSESDLLDIALRDVAKLHGEDVVMREYLGHGASIVWNREPHAGGGFAFFAQGQFGELFVDACEPEGRFHFAGEHLDMVHYWIAGAFNSALRTVWEVLILEGLDSRENLDILFNALGGGDILPSMIPHLTTESSAVAEQLVG